MHFTKTLSAIAVAATMWSMPAGAQNLSAGDIEKLIDEQMQNLNPYQAILNDADPDRALAGMQIMLERGDETLQRMALEYGLLSPNPTVRRVALEGFLKRGPILSIRFDGSQIDDNGFRKWLPDRWNGVVDTDGVGYWRVPIDGYSDEASCFTSERACAITVNSDGVFFTPNRMNGRAELSEDGRLIGSAGLYGVGVPVPFTVQLID